MKKIYQRPQTEPIGLAPTAPLLTLSVGETTNIGVFPGEDCPAEGALIKDNTFEFEWE